MQIPLIRGDKIDSDVDYRDALPVNMYAVPKPIKGASGYMNQWFGLTKVSEGEGIDRGAVWVSREGLEGHYRVSGNSLIKITNGASVVIGSVPGTGQASIVYSFNNIAVVTNGNLYYYNPVDGFRQITDPEIDDPIDIVWADNLFILTDGENVFHSDPLDEESYLPLDFINPQFRPDPSLGLGVNEDNELIVFGQFTIEPYRNIGNDNFVYQRITSKFLKLGVSGTYARAEMNGFWYVLGRRHETSFALHQVRSGGEKKISTREIDKMLSEYTEEQLSKVILEAMTVDNIKMLLIHLPDKVILYNETASEILGSDSVFSILKTDVLGEAPYRGINFVLDLTLNEWVGGDKRNNYVGYLDSSSATHYDDIAEWELYTPLIPIETGSIDELELNTIAGFSPDEDATVAFSMTNDGYFFSQEYWNLYTKNLTYGQRFIMRRVGYIRDDVAFKFRGASRSRMNLSFLNIEVS